MEAADGKHFVIERKDFHRLFEVLRQRGYQIIGPTLQDGAIVYAEIQGETDLPIGVTDEQDGGTYRVKPRNDQALFGYAVGPVSLKKFLSPPSVKILGARRQSNTFEIQPSCPETRRYAFLGVRSCDLQAIRIQDKIFLQGRHVDPVYKAGREQALLIAVNCGQAASTCFCTSMNSGPRAVEGFDLALTEVVQQERHFFIGQTGTSLGEEICGELVCRPAQPQDLSAGEQVLRQTASQIKRTLNTQGIKELLYRNYDHPYWEEAGERCLSCANCTMVCPTCFCSTVEDVTDITGEHAERWRLWDSCFSLDHSYIHGGHVRFSAKARYRQWMTHKLASWQDQFGTTGCVGCGRCIAWCPVGIDITQVARLIRENQVAEKKAP
ncbi:MAG: 4Fe-4S dicluster domain-containing protein [Candidatus Omnitrophota bacterium]|nr:4Fe-4S dicluster domain-containing protein [Candidatus Omnitrophota bacterium]MDZ4242846.1 4Fe-4S dicluster domain-containing protein [Candidatus Omnitrophota bacterium]